MKIAYPHFNDSRDRLKVNTKNPEKSDGHWPKSLYCLYRSTEPVQK